MTGSPEGNGAAYTAQDQSAIRDAFVGRRVLITGSDGMLGRAFVEALAPLGDAVTVRAYAHAALDVTDVAAVRACERDHPDVILHCAGLTSADLCEREPALARAVHVDGTRHVAALARATGARVFYSQSVFIFDGSVLPVTEATEPTPGLIYGRLKLEAERHLLDTVPGTLAVRLAGFFGGDEKDKNFVGQFTRTLRGMLADGQTHCEVGDRIWQPTYTFDHARNVLLILAHGGVGIYHMGALGEATFFDTAQACVDALGLTERVELRPCPAEVFSAAEAARRPHRMVTANERLDREGLNRQRPWRAALADYLGRPHFDALRLQDARNNG